MVPPLWLLVVVSSVVAVVPGGLLLVSSGPVVVLAARPAGVAAPLLLPEEARHVSACVAGQGTGPSLCRVQSVSSQLHVVVCHECHFVSVMSKA